MNISDAKRLRQLEEDNARLKRLVGEQALDVVLKEVISKKLLKPPANREAVHHILAAHGYSERRACRVIQFNRCSARRPPYEDRDLLLRTRMVVRVLERPSLQGRLPQRIKVYNGPEFSGKALDA